MAFKRLEPRHTDYNVSDFIEWAGAGSLDLTPSFQRRTVWKKSARSYLVDTILRGLPIPIIFLREKTGLSTLKTVRQVVDGQQRLHTLLSYIKPEYLDNYDASRDDFSILRSHNPELAGKRFDDLPENYQQSILDYSFSVHVLPSDTSDRDVLEIFRRMNSTGTPLNAQELRHADYSGELASSVSKSALQQLERWRQWGVFSEDNIARMEEVELTADLYNLILKGIAGRTKSTLNDMYETNDESFKNGNEVKRRFRAVFDQIDETLGKKLPSMELSRKTLFYATFAIFYDLMFGVESGLRRSKSKSLPRGLTEEMLKLDKRIQRGRLPKKVADSLSRRTTHVGNRKEFVNYFISQVRNEDAA